MSRQDKLSILITFLVGFFVGGYFYLSNFAFLLSKVTVPEIDSVAEPASFIIVSDVYGGCRSACPSFRLLSDGTFRYIFTPEAGADQVIRQGVVPTAFVEELRAILTPAALTRESRLIEPAFCNSYVDGIDVSYDITLNGELYTLDSCGTAVDGEGLVWVTLGGVWTYFETSGNN